jgi:hypothetical protein
LENGLSVPGKIQEELLEDALKEVNVLPAGELALDLEHAECCPRSFVRLKNNVGSQILARTKHARAG